MAAPVSALREPVAPGGIALIDRSLNGGFAGGPDGLVFVTDRELFGSVRVRRPRAMRRVVPRDLLERLEPGDVVVHVDHGVARYAGLVRRPAGGRGSEERDYLELHFAEAGRIWVPVEQIERVSRYAGGEEPQLSRLGGGEWQRARTRVRKAVGNLARELLALYSERARASGRPFGEGHTLAGRDGGRLPVRGDTRPAARGDRSQGRPRARRADGPPLVGDVGYGKTEVAIRAAFKAVLAGSQVAVLVPTTILAEQHLVTFRQRFAAYPIAVRSLSRFVPRTEQQDTLAGLAAGAVDIVIGTHRLLAGTSTSATSVSSSSTRSSASASATRSASSSSRPRSTS